MARAKMTVNLTALIERFNNQILLCQTKEGRLTLATMIEQILFDHNRYKGYAIVKPDGSYLNGSAIIDDSFRRYL